MPTVIEDFSDELALKRLKARLSKRKSRARLRRQKQLQNQLMAQKEVFHNQGGSFQFPVSEPIDEADPEVLPRDFDEYSYQDLLDIDEQLYYLDGIKTHLHKFMCMETGFKTDYCQLVHTKFKELEKLVDWCKSK